MKGNRRLRAYEYSLLKEGAGRRREEDGTTKESTIIMMKMMMNMMLMVVMIMMKMMMMIKHVHKAGAGTSNHSPHGEQAP